MWIVPAEADLLTIFSETELATYRGVALASGQADPVGPTLAQVVDLVRGYVGAHRANTLGAAGSVPQKLLATVVDLAAVRIPQRVGVSPKEVRQQAAARAIRLLEQVAAGEFNIEEPVVASDETTAALGPTVEARRALFTRRGEEGV